MSFKMKYPITARYLPIRTKRRSGQRITGPRFIVAHDTGNAGSTAANNVSYYTNSANTMSASAHTFIDHQMIIECIPLTEKAWHVMYNLKKDNQLYGIDANDAAIGVELCYGGAINNLEAYKRFVWYLAYLCYRFNLDPMKHIVGHYLLDPARRTDPKNALKHIGKNMNSLLVDVRKEYAECTAKLATGAVTVASIMEDLKGGNELYKPTSAAVKDATAIVLRRLEEKPVKPLDKQWRQKLNNETLTNSDAIGLLYVALERGLIEGTGSSGGE